MPRRTTRNRNASQSASRAIAIGLACVLLAAVSPARAYDVLLRWTVPPEPDVIDYALYSGSASGVYGPRLAVGPLTNSTIDGIVHYLHTDVPAGSAAYFAVTACNAALLESGLSNEKAYAPIDPVPPRADAGPDLHGPLGSAFTVGSAAAPGINYFWEQISGPPGALSGRTSSSAQFSPSATGTVELALIVYDSDGVAARDTVAIEVEAVVASPSATPAPPTPTSTSTRTHTPTSTASATLTFTPTRTATSTAAVIPTATASSGSQLGFSTYFGGTGMEQFRDAVTDAAGNIYLAGGTGSSGVQTSGAVVDSTFNGMVDVLVVKLSPTGQLLWSSVLGGSNYDRAYAIELAPDGDIVLAGRAGDGFPTTAGVVQPAFAGDDTPSALYGPQDGFIARLSPDGTRLRWATYWGTNDSGAIRDVAVDAQGNVYPASAVSGGFTVPHVTAGALQTTRSSGIDGFYAKISGDGTRVEWCTYLGGNADDGNTPSVAVDSQGLVIQMFTKSTDLPTTAGAHDRTYNGGGDLYVARIAPDGSELLWGTYLGGSGLEFSETHGLAVDPAGDVYVAATTMSTNLPVTAGAAQTVYGGSGTGTSTGLNTNYPGDGFVARLGGADGRLVASTYLGGRYGEGVEGVAVDAAGRLLVTGATYSANFPVTSNAVQQVNAGKSDFFVAQLSADLSSIVYATYVGGSNIDNARAATLDAAGGLIALGETSSTDWPTLNPVQAANGGGTFDAGVVRLLVNATATPTGSPQPTSTATPAQSATATLAPTATSTVPAVASPTDTATAIPSFTRTHTPTSTPSFTRTPTLTPTRTFTETATLTATATVTWTATATASATETAEPTLTFTATSTPTLTASRSETPTLTPTRDPTRTPTMAAATASPSSTPTPVSPRRHRVRGFVGYFSSLQAVPGAHVQALGAETLAADTDPAGQFEIDNLEEANWSVQPYKEGDTGDAVSALDAVYVLQATIGLREFQPFQRTLGDVTGNGTLSALDAATILRRAIGIIDSFPVAERCGSDWVFEPIPDVGGLRLEPSLTSTQCQSGGIAFRPLDNDMDNQSFQAGVIGDCTGNWQPTVEGQVKSASTVGDRLHVTVRQERGDGQGEPRLFIDIDTGNPVFAVTIDVGFESAELARRVRVRTVPAVPQLIRAIDTEHPGRVRVAVASAAALRASGGAMVALSLSIPDGADARVERVKVNEDREWRPASGQGASVW